MMQQLRQLFGVQPSQIMTDEIGSEVPWMKASMSEGLEEEIDLTIHYRDSRGDEKWYHLSVRECLIPSAVPRIMTIGFSIRYPITHNGQSKISCVHIPSHRIIAMSWSEDE